MKIKVHLGMNDFILVLGEIELHRIYGYFFPLLVTKIYMPIFPCTTPIFGGSSTIEILHFFVGKRRCTIFVCANEAI